MTPRLEDRVEAKGELNSADLPLDETSARLFLEHFTFHRLIGRGGMGAVYAASRKSDARPVAVKFILGVGRDTFQRFLREMSALERLKHPNIVTLLAQGVAGSTPYLVMELADGGSLEDLLQKQGRHRTLRESLNIMAQVVAGVEYLHANGTIHRDLKPANIFRTGDGKFKIGDFGLTWSTDDDSLTSTNQVMGTPAYMPPEQFLGNVRSPSADVYSCCVILFRLLTGRLPLEAASYAEYLGLHHGTKRAALVPTILDPTLPAVVDELMRFGLNPNPRMRIQNASLLSQWLGRVDAAPRGTAPVEIAPAVPAVPAVPERSALPAHEPDTRSDSGAAGSDGLPRGLLFSSVAVRVLAWTGLACSCIRGMSAARSGDDLLAGFLIGLLMGLIPFRILQQLSVALRNGSRLAIAVSALIWVCGITFSFTLLGGSGESEQAVEAVITLVVCTVVYFPGVFSGVRNWKRLGSAAIGQDEPEVTPTVTVPAEEKPRGHTRRRSLLAVLLGVLAICGYEAYFSWFRPASLRLRWVEGQASLARDSLDSGRLRDADRYLAGLSATLTELRSSHRSVCALLNAFSTESRIRSVQEERDRLLFDLSELLKPALTDRQPLTSDACAVLVAKLPKNPIRDAIGTCLTSLASGDPGRAREAVASLRLALPDSAAVAVSLASLESDLARAESQRQEKESSELRRRGKDALRVAKLVPASDWLASEGVTAIDQEQVRRGGASSPRLLLIDAETHGIHRLQGSLPTAEQATSRDSAMVVLVVGKEEELVVGRYARSGASSEGGFDALQTRVRIAAVAWPAGVLVGLTTLTSDVAGTTTAGDATSAKSRVSVETWLNGGARCARTGLLRRGGVSAAHLAAPDPALEAELSRRRIQREPLRKYLAWAAGQVQRKGRTLDLESSAITSWICFSARQDRVHVVATLCSSDSRSRLALWSVDRTGSVRWVNEVARSIGGEFQPDVGDAGAVDIDAMDAEERRRIPAVSDFLPDRLRSLSMLMGELEPSAELVLVNLSTTRVQVMVHGPGIEKIVKLAAKEGHKVRGIPGRWEWEVTGDGLLPRRHAGVMKRCVRASVSVAGQ